MHALIQLQNNIGSQRKISKPQSNKLLVYKLRSKHPKQNQTQIMHESNKLRIFSTGRKSQERC